ncbi:LamG domain-containing protein [Phanerochaete sordida]|uniref:LamG domain-containing protein n=1 Tax=Phanerochaete sordida TaxID=48140 RepID=A0A9P3GJQ0_9APHY|nr:LamG domain-containing protein [Phanerochaete sordida]
MSADEGHLDLVAHSPPAAGLQALGSSNDIAEQGGVTLGQQLRALGAGPILTIPSLLACWGSKIEPSGHLASYLSTRLPDYFLNRDASFSLYVRRGQSTDDTARVMLVVESPFQPNAIIELGIGVDKGKRHAVYAGSSVTPAWLRSAVDVQVDEWTHIAMVWNYTARTFSLYVEGEAVKTLAFSPTRDANERILRVNKEWRLVIGRGKRIGQMRNGWDGEITDVRVWDRVIDETEINDIRRWQRPEPMNPTQPNLWYDYKV